MKNQDFILPKRNLKTYFRVLYQITRKDWKIYWRYPLNAVSSVFQPLIWLAPVFFLGKTFSHNGEALGFAGFSGSNDYMSFMILGAAISNFISAVFWGMGYAIKDDMNTGVLESNWMTPIPRLLMLIGRTINSLIITTITSLGMLIIAGLIFGFHPTGSVWKALLTVLPMLLGLYGFGFGFAALVMIVREANTMVDMGQFLADLLSGSSFPVKALPGWLLPVSLSIPLTYGYDAVRGILLHNSTLMPVKTEIILLLLFMVIMIIGGMLAFRALEKKVRTRGTLGQY